MRVPFSQTGAGEGLSVIGAAQIIQDNLCAFFACFSKDDGTLKSKYNAIWVFVKNKFRITGIAQWNTDITAETYFIKRTGATVVAETVVKNSAGEIAVVAHSEACVIDLATQRVRRVEYIEMPETEIYAPVSDMEFTRFSSDRAAGRCEFTVPPTAIDFCMHVNNVEYLRFILNSTPVTYALAHPVYEMEIHYVSQAREGEKLALASLDFQAEKEDLSGKVYEIKNGDRVAVRCRILRKK